MGLSTIAISLRKVFRAGNNMYVPSGCNIKNAYLQSTSGRLGKTSIRKS